MPVPDDFNRFDFECPACKMELSEWTEQCPGCGQSLFEVYSGTYRPRKPAWMRWIAVFLLAAVLVGLIAGVLRTLWP